MDKKLTEVRDDFSSRLNLLEGCILQSVKDELTKSSAAIDTRMERLLTALESVVASQKDITDATTALQQTAPSATNSDSSSNNSKSSATSTDSIGLSQSPENKRRKSGEKKLKKLKLKDSIRRILDDRARKSPTTNTLMMEQAPDQIIMKIDSDESMEHIFRQMEEIAQHTSRNDYSSNTHDNESQYTACQEKTDDEKAPPSPGRGQSS